MDSWTQCMRRLSIIFWSFYRAAFPLFPIGIHTGGLGKFFELVNYFIYSGTNSVWDWEWASVTEGMIAILLVNFIRIRPHNVAQISSWIIVSKFVLKSHFSAPFFNFITVTSIPPHRSDTCQHVKAPEVTILPHRVHSNRSNELHIDLCLPALKLEWHMCCVYVYIFVLWKVKKKMQTACSTTLIPPQNRERRRLFPKLPLGGGRLSIKMATFNMTWRCLYESAYLKRAYWCLCTLIDHNI